MTDLMMSMQTAEDLARAYAQLEKRKRELDEMFKESTGRTPAAVKDELRQFMELERLDEIIDPETGRGVRLGKPRRRTEWDTLSMPEGTALALKALNLLDVRTSAFDAMDKAGGAIALEEAKKYRIDGETAAPFEVVRGSDR